MPVGEVVGAEEEVMSEEFGSDSRLLIDQSEAADQLADGAYTSARRVEIEIACACECCNPNLTNSIELQTIQAQAAIPFSRKIGLMQN